MVLVLASCKEDKVVETPIQIADFILSEDIIFAGTSAEQKTVTFQAPAQWTAEVHSTSDWLRAEGTSGKAGAATIRLVPRTDNLGITTRTATLEIYVDGYSTVSLDVEQYSAATGELVIKGRIDEESVMTLRSDATGTIFTDTISVTGTRAWALHADAEAQDIVSFQTDGTPLNGVEKTVNIVVSADYSKFHGKELSTAFSIRTEDGTECVIKAVAKANLAIFSRKESAEESPSIELIDTIGTGSYTADLYIESNIRWEVADKPTWVETSADWGDGNSKPTNLLSSGKIRQGRQHISLKVRPEMLNAKGYEGSLSFKDTQGRALCQFPLTFAGVGENYRSYTLLLPATDSEGNPWAFEANESTVEDGNAPNRKCIKKEFMMTTSVDYSSIDEAPFHILLVDATNGMAYRKEVHWASLSMGDQSLSTKTEGGLCTKQLVLECNERGDKDDKQGLTSPQNSRHAFIFIVPKNIGFNDLWDEDDKLLPAYSDNLVLLTQKNDPDANYQFGFNELSDEATINIDPRGETKTFTIKEGSYMQIDYVIEQKDQNGEWAPASSVCAIEINDNVTPVRLSLSFTENKGVYNPFSHTVVGSPRDIRIRFNAFIGDGMASKTIYTIYAHQELAE